MESSTDALGEDIGVDVGACSETDCGVRASGVKPAAVGVDGVTVVDA